jgi:hypothetical protein
MATVEMLGFTLQTSEIRDEGELIQLIVEPDSEIDERLEARIAGSAGDYFEVILPGEKPTAMRFGQCLWQQTGRGRRHLLRLVREDGDPGSERLGFVMQPEGDNVAIRAFAAHEGLEALLDELARAGVLDAESIQRVRDAAIASLDSMNRDLCEVDDLGQYF